MENFIKNTTFCTHLDTELMMGQSSNFELNQVLVKWAGLIVIDNQGLESQHNEAQTCIVFMAREVINEGKHVRNTI